MPDNPRTAVIIGAGPAGLTAAYELLQRTNFKPLVLESDDLLGGLCRTVNYKGNRIDLGGHRFFSKSDRVLDWWCNILPVQAMEGARQVISCHQKDSSIRISQAGPDPEHEDRVMLVRGRKSRIYFARRFFSYPVGLNAANLRNLGLTRVLKFGLSYLWSLCFPIRNEQNLEQFFINRFGRQLYRTFFQTYTEKVWGVPCRQIGAEWGKQRIKGLNLSRTIAHALGRAFGRAEAGSARKETETSLIEQFLYPKYGPGQMWEEVARRIREQGGTVLTGRRVNRVQVRAGRVVAIGTVNTATRQAEEHAGDLFFSTMPIQDLARAMQEPPPPEVCRIAEGLAYRDFITVGLLLPQLRIRDQSSRGGELLNDNWIYVHEPDVLLGRLQIFNNWSPYMVADPGKVWLGLEYFCNQGDELWRKSDADMLAFAAEELERIGIIASADVLDGLVIRVPKAYPAYFGSYSQFSTLRQYFDAFENLYLIGRNGMHRYNNQDHSMLAALTAVDNIVAGRTDKSNIWEVNTEEEYQEER